MPNNSNSSAPKEPTLKQLKARDDAFYRWKYNPTDENWALYQEALKPIEDYRDYLKATGGYVLDDPKYSTDSLDSSNSSAPKKSAKKTVSKDNDSLSNDSDDISSASIGRFPKSSKYGYYLICSDYYCYSLTSKPNRFYLVKFALNFVCSSISRSSGVIFDSLCLLRVNFKTFQGVVLASYDFRYYASSNLLSMFFNDSLDKENTDSIYSNDLTFTPNELSSDNCVKLILKDFDLRAKKSTDSKEAK